MKQLQFDRRPQAVPGPRKDTIHKPTPQLREGHLYPLAQRAPQGPPVAHGVGGQQEQISFSVLLVVVEVV